MNELKIEVMGIFLIVVGMVAFFAFTNGPENSSNSAKDSTKDKATETTAPKALRDAIFNNPKKTEARPTLKDAIYNEGILIPPTKTEK